MLAIANLYLTDHRLSLLYVACFTEYLYVHRLGEITPIRLQSTDSAKRLSNFAEILLTESTCTQLSLIPSATACDSTSTRKRKCKSKLFKVATPRTTPWKSYQRSAAPSPNATTHQLLGSTTAVCFNCEMSQTPVGSMFLHFSSFSSPLLYIRVLVAMLCMWL
jgi:hypothetical protein